jgi:hypothetical protein
MKHPNQDVIDEMYRQVKAGITPPLGNLDWLLRMVYAQQKVMEAGQALIESQAVGILKRDMEIFELKQNPLSETPNDP